MELPGQALSLPEQDIFPAAIWKSAGFPVKAEQIKLPSKKVRYKCGLYKDKKQSEFPGQYNKYCDVYIRKEKADRAAAPVPELYKKQFWNKALC